MIKAFIFVFIIFTYNIIFLDVDTLARIGDEDNLIENLGAIFLLTASILFITIYSKSSGLGNSFGKYHTNKNVFYILLAAFFFLCFAEEISWGQRIIGWETPTAIKEVNLQEETNLHNLEIFDWGQINLVTLFSVFWLSYFVFVPLLNRYSSRANGFFKTIALPCPPLWIGGLFLVNYFTAKFVYLSNADAHKSIIDAINELKESNHAFNFAVFGIYELKAVLLKLKGREKKPPHP
ncbi:MAG: hypothetical protein NPINA01_14720 [Nitrospinaceae bacterium]|nr:MAG: hypothetical protein NPINA01_14720 [Nitrospinaceae bacterium]